MRILHVNCEFSPIIGGGAVEAHLLYKELASRHEITVLTAAVKGAPASEEMDGMRVIRVPVLNPWSGPGHVSHLSLLSFMQSAVWGAKALKQAGKNFDVLNAWFAIPTGVASYRAAQLLGCPSVLTLCGGDVYDPTKKLAPNNNAFVRKVVEHVVHSHDYVTAISKDLAVRAQDSFNYFDPIEVIPMGIDLSLYKPLAFVERPKVFRWFTACRLVERKGLMSVLEAFAQSKKNFVWHIVGEGPARTALQERARELGLADRIIFEGFVTEERKLEIASRAHAFVLVSQHEGQCQAILEAAAWGLPIVTGNVGGQTDMVRHGETGLLVTPGNEAEISEAITSVMTSPKLRAALSKAILKAVKRYAVEEAAKAYEAYFSRITGIKLLSDKRRVRRAG